MPEKTNLNLILRCDKHFQYFWGRFGNSLLSIAVCSFVRISQRSAKNLMCYYILDAVMP